MRSVLIILGVLWALAIVPAACSAGLVAHGCAGDADVAHACSHEDVCDADPCNVVCLPRDGGDLDGDVDQSVAVLPACVVPLTVVRTVGADDSAPSDDLRHPARGPRPASALLILPIF